MDERKVVFGLIAAGLTFLASSGTAGGIALIEAHGHLHYHNHHHTHYHIQQTPTPQKFRPLLPWNDDRSRKRLLGE